MSCRNRDYSMERDKPPFNLRTDIKEAGRNIKWLSFKAIKTMADGSWMTRTVRNPHTTEYFEVKIKFPSQQILRMKYKWITILTTREVSRFVSPWGFLWNIFDWKMAGWKMQKNRIKINRIFSWKFMKYFQIFEKNYFS